MKYKYGCGYNNTNKLFWKKSKWGLKIYFPEPSPPSPQIFRFVTLPLEIPEKASFYSWKFCKIVLHPLKILRSKTKTHGNSMWIFLQHPWKFHALNCSPPPLPDWVFSGIAQYPIPCPSFRFFVVKLKPLRIWSKTCFCVWF